MIITDEEPFTRSAFRRVSIPSGCQLIAVNSPEPRGPLRRMGVAIRSGWYKAWSPASQRA